MYKGDVYKKGTFVRIKRDLSDESNLQMMPADAAMNNLLNDNEYKAERVIPLNSI
jgi:hypothetical protein